MNVGNDYLDDLLQQCMKLAAQEKITAKNSWGLNLIDHINELGLERDFVRASGAIHASAKIYSGRVDKLYADCAQVASLASGGRGGGVLPETEGEAVQKHTGNAARKSKQAAATVAPETLRLPETDCLARDDHRTVTLRVTVSNTQDILSLPVFLAYQNADFSFSLIPKETQPFQPDEFFGRSPDTQARELMAQSQRVPGDENSEANNYQSAPGGEVAFVEALDAAEAPAYESMLDNSMMVSQLEESALDFFMEVNKDRLLGGPVRNQTEKAAVGPKIPRPRLPRKAAKTYEINFDAPVSLSLQKQKTKNMQKPKEFVFLPCDQLMIQPINLDNINRLLIGDFQTLKNSKLAQDANLSIVIEPSDAISAASHHVQFSQGASFHSFGVEGYGDEGMKSQSQAVYKSNVSLFKSFTTDVQNYDVNLGLQHFKLKFAQKPKVVNIHALKEVLYGEINELSNKKQHRKSGKQVTLTEISELYPERHTAQVARDAGDVSAAYKFVALLHLANEKNLHLENREGEIVIF